MVTRVWTVVHSALHGPAALSAARGMRLHRSQFVAPKMSALCTVAPTALRSASGMQPHRSQFFPQIKFQIILAIKLQSAIPDQHRTAPFILLQLHPCHVNAPKYLLGKPRKDMQEKEHVNLASSKWDKLLKDSSINVVMTGLGQKPKTTGNKSPRLDHHWWKHIPHCAGYKCYR